MFSFDDGIAAAAMLGLAIGSFSGLYDISFRMPAAIRIEATALAAGTIDNMSRVQRADGARFLPFFVPTGVLSVVSESGGRTLR